MPIFGLPTAGRYSASDAALHEFLELAGDKHSIAHVEQQRFEASVINSIERRDFHHHVSEALRARFEEGAYTEMEYASGVATRINILCDAVDKANRAVWPSSRVWMVDRETQADATDPRWSAFLAALNIDETMQRAAWLGWVHKGVYLWPYIAHDKARGKRRLAVRVLTPDVFSYDVCEDDPSTYEGVSLYDTETRGGMALHKRTTWTRDSIIEWYRREGDTRWTLEERRDNRVMHVPGVGIHYEPGMLWHSNHGRALAEATIQANVAQSFATLNSNAQVKMLAGVFDKMNAAQKLRHAGMLDTGASGGELQQMLDFQLDVGAYRANFIEAERRMAAVIMGLPPDEFETTAIPPSGESLRLRYFGQMAQAEARRPAIKRALPDLVWSALAVLAAELQRPSDDDDEPAPPIDGFPDVASLPPFTADMPPASQPLVVRCDVRDMKLPETQAEREARVVFETARGYTTDVHEYKQHNPDALDPAQELADNRRVQAALERPARAASPIAALAARTPTNTRG
jgi:hypothetical protein